MIYPKIILKEGKEKSVLRFHRWIFSGAVGTLPEVLKNGDWVEVFSADDRYLATGYFQDGNIAVRIVSFNKTEIDAAFWEQKISGAIALRERMGYFSDPGTNCFRLVNGEGDELPGLIIDWYNGTAVIQSHSEGIIRSVPDIVECLKNVLGSKIQAIFHKPSYPYNIDNPGELLFGSPTKSTVSENGLTFHINLEKGQKTGYFLDQRENRLSIRKFSAGASMLDAFCYAGGFAANALAGGAAHADAVDLAPVAIELTEKNLTVNNFSGKFDLIQEDVLKFLQASKNNYDLIVLDPPAYAKHLSARHNAVQGYKRLNQVAMSRISRGGILFTFSCSQVVDKVLFENTIVAAAIEAGRMARVLYRLSQPADHPVNIFHPESEYLKGLVLRVE